MDDGGRKTRAIVCFIEHNEHLIQQALALRQSWLYVQSPDTDMVVMGPRSALARIPDDVNKIEQRAVADDPEWFGYRYGNATAYLNGADAHRLDRYSHILHTDVDTFITPAWHKFNPAGFTCGHGGYSNDDNVRQKIREIALEFGLEHRGLINTGATWYGPTPLVRRVAAMTEMLTRYILSRHFRSGEGAWPGWYRGVASMYAAEIAINHCAEGAEKSDQLDAHSTSSDAVHNHAHIHCWHTDEKFSKHRFMARQYSEQDAQNLNLDVIADYAMEMSFRSLRDLTATTASTSVPATAPSRSPSAAVPADTSNLDAHDLVRILLKGCDNDDVAIEMGGRILRNRPDAVSGFAEAAEYHGVSSLLEPVIRSLASQVPAPVSDEVRKVFTALASRHRHATAAREHCIDRLLAAFDDAKVPIILLKGAALAHLVYPDPALRPMVDIDVLVDAKDIERAVKIACELGYVFKPHHDSRFAGQKHHLPAASRVQSGFKISLEIHENCISVDVLDSLTLSTLTAAPRPFKRGAGRPGLALGHVDMLRHLARHVFEPASRVRLKHLYDLRRYQDVFGKEIDWQDIGKRFPHVIVALHLASIVFQLQHGQEDSDGRSKDAPAGIGLGMMPLSVIAEMPLHAKLDALLNPPAWWLHGFYGIPPGSSLLACRVFRHPLTLMRWLSRRLVAAAEPLRRTSLTQAEKWQTRRTR